MNVPKVERWLLLAIALLTIAGTLLLRQAPCRDLSARDLEYFTTYITWQSAFDALSATCGVGLLVSDWSDDYTATGRWVLVGLGALGSILYLSLVLQMLRGMGASLTIWATPGTGVILLFLGGLVGAGAALGAGLGTRDEAVGLLGGMQLGLVSTLSLGLLPSEQVQPYAPWLAGLAWIAALGWPMWLFVAPPLNRRYVQARQALLVAVTYSLFLLMSAGVIQLLEQPRGGVALRPGPESANVESAPAYGQRITQVVLAGSAGLSVTDIETEGLRDGSKFVLATLLLVGGGNYGVGGGLTWILFLWALTGVLFGLRQRPDQSPHLSLWCSSALAGAFALAALAAVGALGLLLIEGMTGSRFAHPPGFVDALLDACSAVGGGNLTSGLTARVTAENLVSGKNLPFSAYMAGMGWLMALMLVGRLLPLLILRRLAERISPTWGRDGN